MLHRATSALVNPVKLRLKVIVILLRNPITVRAAIHPEQECFMVCSQQTVSEVLQSSKGRQKSQEHSRHLQPISTSTQQAALKQSRKQMCRWAHHLKGQGPALLSSTNALFIPVMGPKPERHILNPIFILRQIKQDNLI